MILVRKAEFCQWDPAGSSPIVDVFFDDVSPPGRWGGRGSAAGRYRAVQRRVGIGLVIVGGG
jgi:hypothetical protein